MWQNTAVYKICSAHAQGSAHVQCRLKTDYNWSIQNDTHHIIVINVLAVPPSPRTGSKIALNKFGWAGLFITLLTITLLPEGKLLEDASMRCVTNLLPTPNAWMGWHQYGICADVMPCQEWWPPAGHWVWEGWGKGWKAEGFTDVLMHVVLCILGSCYARSPHPADRLGYLLWRMF